MNLQETKCDKSVFEKMQKLVVPVFALFGITFVPCVLIAVRLCTKFFDSMCLAPIALSALGVSLLLSWFFWKSKANLKNVLSFFFMGMFLSYVIIIVLCCGGTTLIDMELIVVNVISIFIFLPAFIFGKFLAEKLRNRCRNLIAVCIVGILSLPMMVSFAMMFPIGIVVLKEIHRNYESNRTLGDSIIAPYWKEAKIFTSEPFSFKPLDSIFTDDSACWFERERNAISCKNENGWTFWCQFFEGTKTPKQAFLKFNKIRYLDNGKKEHLDVSFYIARGATLQSAQSRISYYEKDWKYIKTEKLSLDKALLKIKEFDK